MFLTRLLLFLLLNFALSKASVRLMHLHFLVLQAEQCANLPQSRKVYKPTECAKKKEEKK